MVSSDCDTVKEREEGGEEREGSLKERESEG